MTTNNSQHHNPDEDGWCQNEGCMWNVWNATSKPNCPVKLAKRADTIEEQEELLSNSQPCTRCNGTGKNPDNSVLGWPGEPCYICLGTGKAPTKPKNPPKEVVEPCQELNRS
jgi:hypothetical protein